MKAPQDIILRPVITEASIAGIAERKYTFKVAKTANKVEIAEAVEKLFPGTKVEKVNTMHVRGRQKTMGRYRGYRPDTKRAIVKLAEGDKIQIFADLQ